MGAMRRTVSCHVECNVTAPARLAWAIAVADKDATEKLSLTVDGTPVELTEVDDGMTRLHVCDAPAGPLVLDYRAEVTEVAPVPGVAPADPVVYLRPSRYVEVDELSAVANYQFHGLQGKDLLDGVVSWVNQQLRYVSGSSRFTDGAVRTYLAREGVCRDFAHLVIAMLRAMNVPARLASVYAPGLDPMDFHAVAEALLDGQWQVVDATLLAPRQSLVRIATGRDASDTAFLTTLSGAVEFQNMQVTAVVDPSLPNDDTTMLTQLR